MTPRPSGPIDGKTFVIGVLSVTACILFIGFMLITTQSAQAVGMNDEAGDYKMLTMQINRSTELVVITDAAAERAIFYGFDYSQKRLEMLATIPLKDLPKPPEPAGDEPAPARRRRP